MNSGSFGAIENSFDDAGALALPIRAEVSVAAGRFFLGMAQQLADAVQRDPSLRQPASECVPQRVEHHAGAVVADSVVEANGVNGMRECATKFQDFTAVALCEHEVRRLKGKGFKKLSKGGRHVDGTALRVFAGV